MSTYRRKLKPISRDFVIVFDHREEGRGKRPLKFGDFEMERTTLKTADYSIKGYEGVVGLEHKSGIAELYKDLVVSYRPTFVRFLHRLADMKVRAIIVEEELSAVRVKRVVNKLRYSSNGSSRLTEKTAWHWIAKIQCEFGVPIVFCDRKAARLVAENWMLQAYRMVRSERVAPRRAAKKS